MCNSRLRLFGRRTAFDKPSDSFGARGNVGLASAPFVDKAEEVVADAHYEAMFMSPRHAGRDKRLSPSNKVQLFTQW
jgi:hypothetical protein